MQNCSFVAVKFRSPKHRGESISHIWKAWQSSGCKHGIKGGNVKLNGESLRTELDMVTRGICVGTIVIPGCAKRVDTRIVEEN